MTAVDTVTGEAVYHRDHRADGFQPMSRPDFLTLLRHWAQRAEAQTPVASPEGVVATGDHSGRAEASSLASARPAPAPPVPGG